MAPSFRIAAIVLAGLGNLAWGSAMATPVTNPDEIPQDRVCVGSGPEKQVSTPKFTSWLLDNFGITRECERSAGGALTLLMGGGGSKRMQERRGWHKRRPGSCLFIAQTER